MDGIAQHLIAPGPEPELADQLNLFGQFVGTWTVRNRYRPDPRSEWAEGERTWVFSWVLGGRAVQDVILGSDRDGHPAVVAGSTMRAFDPALSGWRVNWFGTLHANFGSLIARGHEADGIRQDGVEYTTAGDVPIRWNFSGITERSFSWDGWSQSRDGTWWLEQHMDAERAG
jgi:hypothetical protein